MRVDVERIENPDGEGGAHRGSHLIALHPADFARFGGRVRLVISERTTPEHQRDHTLREVLVDAGEALDLDTKARLFKNFSTNAVFEGFLQLQHAARRFPTSGICALDCKNSFLTVNHDACDADGVFW
jgi:hypothetical protein